jgi:hypothetical protein
LFGTRAAALQGAASLRKAGFAAVATTTLTRQHYWKGIFDC